MSRSLRTCLSKDEPYCSWFDKLTTSDLRQAHHERSATCSPRAICDVLTTSDISRARDARARPRYRVAGVVPFRANATNALSAPVPVAMTMNCRPDFVRYVMGLALLAYGTLPRQISLPVRLSNA